MRWFDSKLERTRGEQLFLMEKAGDIEDLQFQVPFVLCDIRKHKIKVVLDFMYKEKIDCCDDIPFQEWRRVYEDAKGKLTDSARIKYAWLFDKYKIDVVLWPPKDTRCTRCGCAVCRCGE
jgi:hypothetical protein